MEEKRLRKTLITELSTFKHSTREGSQWWGGERRVPRERGKEGGRGGEGERNWVVFWPLRSLIQMLRHGHTDNRASDTDATKLCCIKKEKKKEKKKTSFLDIFLDHSKPMLTKQISFQAYERCVWTRVCWKQWQHSENLIHTYFFSLWRLANFWTVNITISSRKQTHTCVA